MGREKNAVGDVVCPAFGTGQLVSSVKDYGQCLPISFQSTEDYLIHSSGYVSNITCRSHPEHTTIEEGLHATLIMEEVTCHESHPSFCSDTKMLQLSDEVQDSPDWLPSGWILEMRTQKSGAYAGRQIKCYYDPSTDSRFYSKKAVFRHLNTEKVCGPVMRQTRSVAAKSLSECCSETNEEENMKNSTNNALVEHAPTELPEGWTKEIRVRKGDGRKKDTALVEHAPTELPEGWTKEIRVRKGDGRKKDTFYIDPASEYAFRSLKDAFRYIETGDIFRCASKPQKRDSSGTCTIEKESHSPTADLKGDRRGNSVQKCLFAGKGSGTDVKKLTEIYQSPESSSSPQWDHASTTSEEDDSNCKIANNKILDNKNKEGVKLVSTPDFTCGVGSPEQTSILGKVNISRLQNNAAKTSEEALQAEWPHLNGEWFQSVATEKKHEHVNFTDLEPLSEAKESNPSPNALLGSSKLVLNNKELSEHKNEEPSDLKKPKRGRKKKADQAITTPVRASKRLAAFRVNASNESETDEGNIMELEKDDKVLGSSSISHLATANSSASKTEHPENLQNLEPLSKELCSHEQVELGTLNNNKEPIYASPFGDSWPDPCIEFAFKTLTSDIPFLDDLMAMQQYFQHQQMGPTPGPSLDCSLGNGNQGHPNQNEHLIQLNPWNEHFVPFTDDGRSRPIEKGMQSCKKVN